MKNQKFKAHAFLLVCLCSSAIISAFDANATERIRSMRLDKSKVETVYITPGMATVMTFPCEIDEAIVGREQDLKATVSPTTKRQLMLFLSSPMAASTNLIVRCGKKSDPMVFDLVSNKTKHQDVLKVSNSYGAPKPDEEKDQQLISSSSAKKKRSIVNVMKPVLIEESK